MKEEDELLKKCGTKNPFMVPEGYFDNDDNVEIFRENGIIAIAQDYKARFSNILTIIYS